MLLRISSKKMEFDMQLVGWDPPAHLPRICKSIKGVSFEADRMFAIRCT